MPAVVEPRQADEEARAVRNVERRETHGQQREQIPARAGRERNRHDAHESRVDNRQADERPQADHRRERERHAQSCDERGWDELTDAQYLRVYVRQLRQKIEADASKPERIITVRGGGYRFEG